MLLINFLLTLPDDVSVIVRRRHDFGHSYRFLGSGLSADILNTFPTHFLYCLVELIRPDYDNKVITVCVGRPRGDYNE